MGLSHRERVLRAFSHEAADRVAVDFGGGPATQIHPDAYARLLRHLGFEPEESRQAGRGAGQVIVPSEKVLQHFDIDVRGIYPGRADGNTSITLDPHSYVDEWGATWQKADMRAPYINVKGPLQDLVDPTPEALETIAWPSPTDPGRVRGLRERADTLREQTDYAIVLNLGNTTFALAQRLRGFAELLEDLLLNPTFASALMERVTDIVCGMAEAAVGSVADLVDAVSTADDMGTQTQSFMHPDLYRSMVKPHHARLATTIHRLTQARFILHSDGAIRELLPDLIDIGIDVLNPVQVNAVGMAPADLKREFGRDLCFWGGIDTQQLLPFGSPSDVAREVRARIEDLGHGGGYVVASVHNIQAEVPAENIVAMYEAATMGTGTA
jgi:uroporphyrinogen decarboxylase|tara:strand:- start:3217 stop:4365 length:1149 start_codon:yes stop_codon:yes gene_type:complete